VFCFFNIFCVFFYLYYNTKWGGGGGGVVSPALLSTGAMCVCMYLGGCLNWHILSLPWCCCCHGSRVFIATLGLVFHWKVLAWLELKSSQRKETSHSLPSMMCPQWCALTEISKNDFKVYLDLIFEPYNRFVDVREHLNREQNNEGNVVVVVDLENVLYYIKEIQATFFFFRSKFVLWRFGRWLP